MDQPAGPGKKAINIVHTNVTAESISRYEILSWVNSTLRTDLTKVEELCSGTAYCRLMEHLFGPGTVQLKRVKFASHLEHEFTQNFKILQIAFNACGVDRAIPIEKLVKGRYTDNYDFAQWFKMFYDANYVRRPEVPKPVGLNTFKARTMEGGKLRPEIPIPPSPPPLEAERVRKYTQKTFSPMKPFPISEYLRRPATAAPAIPGPAFESIKKPLAVHQPLSTHLHVVKQKLNELNVELQSAVESLDGVWKERNFLLMSLTQIEGLCESEDAKESSSPEMAALLHRIFRVLKRDPNSGFFGTGMGPEKRTTLIPEAASAHEFEVQPIGREEKGVDPRQVQSVDKYIPAKYMSDIESDEENNNGMADIQEKSLRKNVYAAGSPLPSVDEEDDEQVASNGGDSGYDPFYGM